MNEQQNLDINSQNATVVASSTEDAAANVAPSTLGSSSPVHSTGAVTRNNVRLETAIQDAQILLAYAAERGGQIDQSVTQVIVASGSLYAQDAMDDAAETGFWLAFNTLAKSVSPVTVNSLQAVLDPQQANTRKLLGLSVPRISLARSAVRWYTILAIVTLCTLLTIQIYWLFGKQITSDIQTITDKHTEAKAKWEAARLQALKPLVNAVNKTDGKASDTKTNSSANKLAAQDSEGAQISSGNVVQDIGLFTLKAQEQTYLLHKKSSYESLHVWSRIWAIFLPNPQIEVDDPGEKRIYDNSILLQSSTLLLDALQRYLLPLLYGLLGTCVYVLRTLSSEISARTYSEASNIGFRIRLYLGTLGGMVFAWFVIPDQTDGLFKSLSPFALAFLAGYSVEILFAAMDRFLVAFTTKQS